MPGVQSGGTRYSAVAHRFVSLIERGTLRAGDRLPSLRRTSRAEGVSLTTSLQAYALLEMRGYVEARPQSGFYVRPHAARDLEEPSPLAPRRTAADVDVSNAARLFQAAQDPRLVAFGAACPSAALLPTRRLARLASAIARAQPIETNAYSFPPGRLELRREISKQSLGWQTVVTADRLLITCGATEALTLALMATTRRGEVVAVECPTYFGTLLILQTLGLRVVEIATDPRTGISLSGLKAVLDSRRVAAVIASPTCQNPLGSVMADEGKRELVALLGRSDVPLIEDDVYGEAIAGRERPAPAKAWDRHGRVLLCSSFSKTLAPGYRVGWIAGGRYHDALVRLKLATTLASPALPQLVIAAFMRSGAQKRFLKDVRRSYADQVTRGREAIARFFPRGTRVTQPQGGFLLWVEMPPTVDAVRLADDALAAGISVAPGPIFSARGGYRNCLRLSCGAPWTPQLDRAMETLGRLANSQR
jgi:DNA-binding transcriptional MocR family regulator